MNTNLILKNTKFTHLVITWYFPRVGGLTAVESSVEIARAQFIQLYDEIAEKAKHVFTPFDSRVKRDYLTSALRRLLIYFEN